jgi:hypothetical protein
MKLLRLVFVLSLLPFATFAQDTTFLKKQAKRFAEATFKNDHETIIALTYPALIEMTGGPEMMQKLIGDKIEGLRNRGITKFDGTVGSPGKFYKAGTEIHCLLPESIILKMKKGHYTGSSYLLAITPNKGKSWWFMDVGNMPADVLHKLLPNYNNNLVIPVAGKPVYFVD